MSSLFRDPNLRLIFGVTLMVVLGVSSIIPVIPDIGRAYALDPAHVGLVVAAFTLPGIFLTPVWGVVADRFGRRVVLLPAMIVFALTGAACFFAPDFATLLALRVVQGGAAAALGVLSGTLLGDYFIGPELATATGLNAAVLSVGTAGYPFLGGLLGAIGWRWPFLLALLAIPLCVILAKRLHPPKPTKTQSLSGYLRGALQGMRAPEASGIYIASLVTFVLLYGPLVTYTPILLSNRFSADSITIGLIVCVASFFSGLAASQLGRLVRFAREQTLMRVAFLLYALSFALVPFVGSHWGMIIPVSLFGLAQGLNIPGIMTVLNRIAPPEYRAAYMAANATLLRVGQTIGPLLMGAVYAFFGLDAVFYVSALLGLGMFLVSFKLLR